MSLLIWTLLVALKAVNWISGNIISSLFCIVKTCKSIVMVNIFNVGKFINTCKGLDPT
jgi:hypothetical protein